MAQSKNSFLSALASSVTSSGTVPAAALAPEVTADIEGAGTAVYDSASLLPIAGNTAGDTAFVKSTSRLYIHSGLGWYNVAVINNTPTVQSITDSDGGTTPFSLATDGTPTTITITAQDSDGDPLTYNYSADSNLAGLATLSQADNVFTITPLSEDSATTTSGTITFTVTDGINTATPAAQTFTLAFANWDFSTYSLTSSQEVSTAYTITREASIWVDPGGSYYAIVGRMDATIRIFNSTNYALGTSQYRTFSTGLAYTGGIFLKPDGSKMWIFNGSGNEELREYDLTTNYDVSSATNLTTHTINDASAASYGGTLGFSASGDYFWIDNGGVAGINSWSLSTPYDVTTRSSVRLDYVTTSLEWGSNQAHMSTFSPDGSVWIVYGGDANNANAKSIFSYNLSTPFDPQSATTLIGKTTVNNYGGGYNNNGIHALGGHVHFYDRNYGHYRHYSG